jgi:hypothetical protein
MAAALSNQIENRCFEMNIGVSRKIESMKLLQTSSAEVMKSTKSILGSFEKTELIPLNLEVLSARLGPKGQQLLVVANQYQKNGH